MQKIRVFEAFAGIGAQRKALNKVASSGFEIIGMAEWHVPAIIMYQAIHNNYSIPKVEKYFLKNQLTREEMEEHLSEKPLSWDSKNLVSPSYWKKKKLNELRIIYLAVKQSEEEGNIFDVRTLYERTLKNIDLLTYSFPCQDLSQQGSQKGMKKGSNTRSGLLWEIEKALDSTQPNDLPTYLLMENVPALMHSINQNDLNKWMKKLESLGYHNSIQILNAGDFGSAQARRRVFMISTKNKLISLPVGNKKPKTLFNILDKDNYEEHYIPALEKYDLTDFTLTKSNIKKAELINYSNFHSEAFVYDPNFTGPTLTASGANSRIKIYINKKIRKMNSREALKYMGFTEGDYNKISNLQFINETQILFAAGNSISVEVLEKIMEKIYNE